jgi:hypothetical protein
MKLTSHAARRIQQRHLSPLVVDLLQHYGQVRYQSGSTVLYFNEKGWQRAEDEVRKVFSRINKIRDAYLVEANDTGHVVTIGYRYERIKEK